MENTKTFTFVQLWQVVDGRLTTTDTDLQTILKHLFQQPVLTNEIPHALDVLKAFKPLWYSLMEPEMQTLKMMYIELKMIGLTPFHYLFKSKKKREKELFVKMIEFVKNDPDFNVSITIPPLDQEIIDWYVRTKSWRTPRG